MAATMKPHLYTLHPTYTGADCAMCGEPQDSERHDKIHKLVDGVKIVIATGERAERGETKDVS